MSRRSRRIFLGVVAATIAFIGLEVICQVGFRIKNRRWVFEHRSSRSAHRELFESHPFLVGRLRANVTVEVGGTTITATAHHTRWTGEAKVESGCVRVAVLGGSTAFGTKVSDEDSWPALLQKELGPGFCVRNFGFPGYSTAEGTIQMALIVPGFDPDIVIVYEGWNDIKNYHDPEVSADFFKHGIGQRSNLGLDGPRVRDLFWRNSAIVRIIRAALVRTGLMTLGQPLPASRDPDPVVDLLYQRNLETIALLAENMGARVLFVPQVLNASYYLQNEGADQWSPRIENHAMPSLMFRFNQLMESVCEEQGAHCQFVAEVSDIDWDSEDFMDAGHFSGKGGKRLSEVVRCHVVAAVSQAQGDLVHEPG